MKSIKTKLIVYITLICLFISLLIGSVSLYISSNSLKKQVEKELILTSEKYAYKYEVILTEVESTIESLGTTLIAQFDLEKAKTDPNYLQDYERQIDPIIKEVSISTNNSMGAYFEIDPSIGKDRTYGAWYYDKEGNKNFVKGERSSIEEFDRENEGFEWYYRAIDAKKGVWLDPYVDTDINVYMISYTIPLYKNGILLGVVGMDMNFNELNKPIKDVKLYDTGYISLLNSNQNFLVHPTLKQSDNLESAIGQSASEEISKKQKGIIEYTYKEIRKIMGYVKLHNGYILITNIPNSEAFSSLNKLILVLLLIITISIILSIVMALFLGTNITKGIIKSTKIIEKTSSLDLTNTNDLDYLLKSKDEVGVIVKSIENMRKILNMMILSLKEIASETFNHAKILSDETDQTAYSIKEVSATVEQLAKGAIEQAENSEKGLGKLIELAKKINLVTTNSNLMKQYVEETNNVSEKGRDSIKKLDTKIEDNNKMALKVAQNVHSLHESSNLIDNITNTIKSIVSQINLLSFERSNRSS